MKVLQVNNVDLPGRRFNGFDLLDDLGARGVAGAQAVLAKESADSRVISLLHGPQDHALQDTLCRAERRHSMNNLLYPWGRVLECTNEFGEADVVHYHLLQNRFISLLDLPRLFSLKPTVWTFHDAWPLTGHCTHPRDCLGWLDGCPVCPHLDWLYPMDADCAARMWRIKQRVYSELDVDVVVASDYMLDAIRRSPLADTFERTHLIPFGVDGSAFLPDSEQPASRHELGIPQDDYVVLFRSTANPIKGLAHIIQALTQHPPGRATSLLTVDERGLLGALDRDYRVVELGWTGDNATYARALSACDVFLMPSAAEGFGLMAVEAMAAGRPVVCFQSTALESVTRAPKCGIAVPYGDSQALREAIDRLASTPEEARRRGEVGRALVRDLYSHDRYVDSLVALYQDAQMRFQARTPSDKSLDIGP